MNNQIIDENKKITDYSTWMLFNLARNSVYRLRELELAQFGLTVEQSIILYLLINRGGSATARTIEYLTLRQHHSISTLINRMVKLRLVTRKKSLESKKSEILITRHGKDLYKKVPFHSMEMLFSSLKEKDRERLRGYLVILLAKARDLLGLSFVPPFLQNVDLENNGKKKIEEYAEVVNPTDFELWIVFNRTRNSMYRLRELELDQLGLTVEQSAILYLLTRQGGSASAKTIEYLTLRQHHSISTLVNRMIKMDLVTRKKSPDSKRFDILITTHGEELHVQAPIHSIEMVFSSLKAKDRERLHGYLTVLLEKARDLLGLSYVPPFLLKQSQSSAEES
jgi:DNA-binding MarR family transcriptional regulator